MCLCQTGFPKLSPTKAVSVLNYCTKNTCGRLDVRLSTLLTLSQFTTSAVQQPYQIRYFHNINKNSWEFSEWVWNYINTRSSKSLSRDGISLYFLLSLNWVKATLQCHSANNCTVTMEGMTLAQTEVSVQFHNCLCSLKIYVVFLSPSRQMMRVYLLSHVP